MKVKFISSPKIYGLLYSISSFMALVILLCGVVVSLVSSGVLGIWVGMEINFLGAICFMSGVYVEESESVMKYFIIQVVGSCFMVLGLLMLVFGEFVVLVESFSMMGLAIKLGIFPFHFWVAGVLSSLSWFACFVVSVVQKVAPLWLLSNFCLSGSVTNVMEVLGVLTCLVGCLGGIGMLNYRALLAYSSLVHLGFLIILCLVEVGLFWSYLFVYGLLNLFLMWSMWNLGIYGYSDLVKEGGVGYYTELLWVSFYFLSLAGIPPFSGIFLKVYFFNQVLKFCSFSVCFMPNKVGSENFFFLKVVMDMGVYWGKKTFLIFCWKSSNFSKIGFSKNMLKIVFGFPFFLIWGE
uniref:NADH-ubiquinone oxidoreductase chain 2 n=1 Tax=Meretrix lyrata TaxID=223151 RepID=V5JV93_9BIVA|nr:NADH dehydrogenase subunit 2 [Meretrix lyrata]AGR50826.1 NADH dehydrogenase subunit 2 [Meretrix lyrata]